MKMTIRLPALSAAFAAAMALSAHAEDANPKAVWGGGPAAGSAYTANYVPKVIEVLDSQHLSGYSWGGVSPGTVANAEKSSKAAFDLDSNASLSWVLLNGLDA